MRVHKHTNCRYHDSNYTHSMKFFLSYYRNQINYEDNAAIFNELQVNKLLYIIKFYNILYIYIYV